MKNTDITMPKSHYTPEELTSILYTLIEAGHGLTMLNGNLSDLEPLKCRGLLSYHVRNEEFTKRYASSLNLDGTVDATIISNVLSHHGVTHSVEYEIKKETTGISTTPLACLVIYPSDGYVDSPVLEKLEKLVNEKYTKLTEV